MPDDPPWAGSLAAIETANFNIRLKPSTVEMFGIIMPSRTATPHDARPRSARLPAMNRPSLSSASIAVNDRMMTSVFSPPAKRSLSAPTVLKCSSMSRPVVRVNSGASSLTGPSTAPALMTLTLPIRRSGCLSVRAIPGMRVLVHIGPDVQVGIAANHLAGEIDILGFERGPVPLHGGGNIGV